MNEQKTLTLEELRAEQSKIAGLIKIAKEARIAALRKELDELLNDAPATSETTEVTLRKTTGRRQTSKEASVHGSGSSPVVRN